MVRCLDLPVACPAYGRTAPNSTSKSTAKALTAKVNLVHLVPASGGRVSVPHAPPLGRDCPSHHGSPEPHQLAPLHLGAAGGSPTCLPSLRYLPRLGTQLPSLPPFTVVRSKLPNLHRLPRFARVPNHGRRRQRERQQRQRPATNAQILVILALPDKDHSGRTQGRQGQGLRPGQEQSIPTLKLSLFFGREYSVRGPLLVGPSARSRRQNRSILAAGSAVGKTFRSVEAPVEALEKYIRSSPALRICHRALLLASSAQSLRKCTALTKDTKGSPNLVAAALICDLELTLLRHSSASRQTSAWKVSFQSLNDMSPTARRKF